MQTTLRIDDRLYREAKAEATREGVTLTRFLEEGLRLRLEKKLPTKPAAHLFRVYESKQQDVPTWEEIRKLADEEQEDQDLSKIGITFPSR
jgi:hypothetical protein